MYTFYYNGCMRKRQPVLHRFCEFFDYNMNAKSRHKIFLSGNTIFDSNPAVLPIVLPQLFPQK